MNAEKRTNRIAPVLLVVVLTGLRAQALSLNVSSGGPNDWAASFYHDTLSSTPEPLPPSKLTVQVSPGIAASIEFRATPSIPGDPSSPLWYLVSWSGPPYWGGPLGLSSFPFMDGIDYSEGGGDGITHQSDWHDTPGGDGWLYNGYEQVRVSGDGVSTLVGQFSYWRAPDPNFFPVPDTGPAWLLAGIGILSLFVVRRYARPIRHC